MVSSLQGVEKPCCQAGQKGPRCEAREKPISGVPYRGCKQLCQQLLDTGSQLHRYQWLRNIIVTAAL